MKLYEVVEGNAALGTLVNKEMPGWVAFRIARAIKGMQPILQTFEAQKDALVTKYGTDGQITRDDLNWKEFADELNQILDEEVTFEFTPVALEHLGAITPRAVLALGWFIQESENEDEGSNSNRRRATSGTGSTASTRDGSKRRAKPR